MVATKKNLMEDLKTKKNMDKASLCRISVNELPKSIPDLKNPAFTKDSLISNWLQTWIESDLKAGKIQINNLLPKKDAIADYLGVSVGTVQNAIRYIEDNGYVESKQRIGTLIRDYSQPINALRKQTSKRDLVIAKLKQLIIKNEYKLDAPLPSSREISKMLGSASNTTRLALEHLASTNVIETKGCRGNKSNWILRNMPKLSAEENKMMNSDIETDTLVDQVERDLKDYISENFALNDKLPAHFELADTLKVSIKTVHDAMKRLIEQGILRAKRGRYGTTITRMPNAPKLNTEDEIFAPASDAQMYNYEVIEKKIRAMIIEEHKIGSKLPAMGILAKKLDVSSNTIRKALQNLAKEDIIEFSRGRYGGTFVIQMPKADEQETSTFKWLSINPENIAVYKRDLITN